MIALTIKPMTKRARAMYFKVKLPLSTAKYSIPYRIAPTMDKRTNANRMFLLFIQSLLHQIGIGQSDIISITAAATITTISIMLTNVNAFFENLFCLYSP